MSPNARPEVHWLALAEKERPPAPGDGGGRVWLERVTPIRGEGGWSRTASGGTRAAVPAASRHRFELVYEAGPEGVAIGGFVFLSPEIFWEWSPAQSASPEAPGYVTARVLRGQAKLAAVGGGGFRVDGERLAPGDQIAFVYGAGPRGALSDRYAERGAGFLFAVDADGDGFRAWVDDGPRLDILPREPAILLAHGPAELAPGAPLELVVALVDRQGNRVWPGDPPGDDAAPPPWVEIEVLPSSTAGLAAPPGSEAVPVSLGEDGAARVQLGAVEAASDTQPATLRLRLRGGGRFDGFEALAPPIVVRDATRRLVWADLHGHTRLSDGTGSPDAYLEYARLIARLDAVSLTDHDHWGPSQLDATPARSQALFDRIDRFERPGRFVTLPGYEWTSWLHGHRHVLYFDPPGAEPRPQLFSSIDPATDRPDELWAALSGRNALTFAHHSAGEPIATNWAYRPPPQIEPVTEIASVHGQSEAPSVPDGVRGGIPGNFVADVLAAGSRLGFIGSGDSHDGHPGLAQLAAGRGGLAGLFVETLDRASLRAALARRQTFATNGIRPFFEVRIDDVPMGGVLRARDAERTLEIFYEGTAEVAWIDLVRSGRVARLEPAPSKRVRLTRRIPPLAAGAFHYVRIGQEDGGIAWSSPIFVDP